MGGGSPHNCIYKDCPNSPCSTVGTLFCRVAGINSIPAPLKREILYAGKNLPRAAKAIGYGKIQWPDIIDFILHVLGGISSKSIEKEVKI